MDTPWSAWQGTRSLAFLHARVRELLLHAGVHEREFVIDGKPIHAYEAGPEDAERTVVLLHGLGASANDWARIIPYLAKRGDHVIAPDLPGHGWTPPSDARGFLHIHEHAALIKTLVETHARGDSVALVGHSLGGWVATRAHLSGLELSRLVLVETAGLQYEGMWDSLEMLRIEKEEDVRRFFRTIIHQRPVGLEMLSREITAMFRQPAVANFIDGYAKEDVLVDEELANIRAPTHILWGEHDGLIPPSLAHRWHSGIEGSTLVWIPRCGHAPQFERPLLYQRLLADALGHTPLHLVLRDRIKARIPEAIRRRLARA